MTRFEDLSPGDVRLTTDILQVLQELRHDLTAEQFSGVYAEGYPQGLRFTAVYDGESCVAVAGWRLMSTTVALRKLYVDDLVTASNQRGRGFGAALLHELQRRAREAGCRAIELDSGTHRIDAHRFYFRERMGITSLHFTRLLTEN
jgi:GNAT superfamily N-acetyltransferase